MKNRILTLLMTCVAGLWAASADFDKGMRALGANDCGNALSLLESALSAEPDNIRYASEYRQAVLRCAQSAHPKEGRPADFDRELTFFDHLTAKNPAAANAWLNYGFAIVDKMPATGSITQVILANTALGYFSKAIDLKPDWIGYYTRGNSYLFWPRVFGRAPLGLADLQKAYNLQIQGPSRVWHVRAYISLGDAYWKTDQIEKARDIWTEGVKLFPANEDLKARLNKSGEDLKQFIENQLDPNKRVDTDLKDLWAN